MQKTNKKQVKTTTKQKIGLIIFGILLAFVILELGLRIGGFVLSSYQRASNKEGFDADYKILCLGESTTALGGKYSWPAQLEKILNNKSQKIKFKVFNEGIAGTNTAFILSGLKDNLNKYKPDIVITLMHINDGNLIFKYEENLKVKIALSLKDLRIFSLSKLLWKSWKNKIKSIITKDNILTNEIKEKVDNYTELGENYRKKEKYEKAEKILKKVIEMDPKNNEAYSKLASIYLDKNNFTEAAKMFKKAIELNPNNGVIYLELGQFYYDQGRLKEAERMFVKAIEINPNMDEAYCGLGIIYNEQGLSDKEIEEFYRKRGFSIRVQNNIPSSEITKYHYQQLYKELNKRGIKYIAMQYPTLNINELRDMFEGNEDIIFVSNEENFKKALENGKYEDYFIDHIRDTFGHATPKGNRLIAENVANVILEELDID